MVRSLFTAFVLALFLAANQGQEGKAAELKVESFTFKVGAPWIPKVEPRMMSAGGFALAGKGGVAPIEADFYHFGSGGGGGIEPNLKRWQSQFTLGVDGKPVVMEREEIGAGSQKALLVTIKGTFLSGPAMSPNKVPMPNYVMLGAILSSSEGDVFLKVTGPEAATLATKAQLKEIVKAAFAK